MTNEKKTGAAAPVEFDLATLDTATASDAGARIDIVHPVTKTPLGLFVTVLGKHSNTFRELVRERINKRIKEESLAARRGKPLEPRSAEEVEREAIEMLIACTTGWGTDIYEGEGKERHVKETKPTILFSGERYEFNAQNAALIYTKM